MAVSLTSSVAAAFAVISVILGAAGVATPAWYIFTVAIGSGSLGTTIGLFKICEQGQCSELRFNDVSTNNCSRSATDQRSRFTGVTSVTIVGVGLMGLTAIAILAGLCANRLVRILGLGLGATATLCLVAGLSLFGYLMESWVYCDQNVCQFTGIPTCSASLGYSYFLVAAAAVCGLLACIFHVVGLVSAHSLVGEKAVSATEPVAPEDGAATPRDTSATMSEKVAIVSPPPGGDWVLDEPSGMYWSDREYLYLDVTIGHYYDPELDLWGDPQSQRWYHRPA